ncbi:MAG: adenylate/guanylate cyclase domain-containing protein [Proteobacteria bacterium]|nr:MAG: adenylate/guanylate cyclase domain-containing protein [Pseudomonadota bacterium]
MVTLNISATQLPSLFRSVIDSEISHFNKQPTVTVENKIPDTPRIPITNPIHWIKIPSVIAVVVDMRGSTKFSASANPRTTAKAYRLFSETAVRLFHEFDSKYIDVKGDGVFGLFDSAQPHIALASAVTFKTFCSEIFIPSIKSESGLDVGVRIGIDCKDVLVRKIGLKVHGDRSDRQNEVWAGKPINMAFKLASLANADDIVVSERYHKMLTNEKALKSCGCPSEALLELWEDVDVEQDDMFDFKLAKKLKSSWCKIHGAEYCSNLMATDDD